MKSSILRIVRGVNVCEAECNSDFRVVLNIEYGLHKDLRLGDSTKKPTMISPLAKIRFAAK